jgi:hypothetical protein
MNYAIIAGGRDGDSQGIPARCVGAEISYVLDVNGNFLVGNYHLSNS